MRGRIIAASILGVAVCSALVTFTLTHGQTSPQAPKPETPPADPPRPAKDLSKLPPLQRQMYLTAQRGADWLVRCNRPDGRFVYGYLPALAKPLDGDHYLRQAGAAFALARAARFSGDGKQSAIARQAILTLLLDTSTDPNKPGIRYSTLPATAVNRLAAAGLLVLAINELPSPAADLLEQSEQLCVFIGQQQQADGSFALADRGSEEDSDGINFYPGEALYGLMRSQGQKPAPWKSAVARRALAFYRPWWQQHKNPAFVPWQAAAFTEAFLISKEKPFADFVNEMSDWLCELQYTQLDPRHPLWLGGFMGWTDGKPVQVEPNVGSAAYAEALAEACRLARQTGDLQRYQHFCQALERDLQFLATLQYTEGNTTHFADWYRPTLVGGFHASHEDGNLRIDYTQHAVSALVQYLAAVID